MSPRALVVFALLLAGSPALAASDVTVTLTAPAGVKYYVSGRFDALVRNIGNKSASNVSLTVQLPVTHTSPTVHILGDLGTYDTRCSVSGTKLVCPLSTIARGKSTTVTYWITMPYATVPLVYDATVTTTSIENSTANNRSTRTGAPAAYTKTIVPRMAAVNDHCTGTGLTSFFECELYPSSISSHDSVFEAGSLISFPNQPGNYSGSWSQPSSSRLQFSYFDTGSLIATFDGYATSANCFEGQTVFSPPSPYNSMYQVCVTPIP